MGLNKPLSLTFRYATSPPPPLLSYAKRRRWRRWRQTEKFFRQNNTKKFASNRTMKHSYGGGVHGTLSLRSCTRACMRRKQQYFARTRIFEFKVGAETKSAGFGIGHTGAIYGCVCVCACVWARCAMRQPNARTHTRRTRQIQ